MNIETKSPQQTNQQSEWKEIPGYKVKRQPMLLIQKIAAWVLVGPLLLFWIYFVFEFFTKRKPDGALVIFLVSIPVILISILGINLFFTRRTIRKLDVMSNELGLDAFCYYGAPLWMVHYPHFRGFRNGHTIQIDFVPNRGNFKVTLSIRGTGVDQITDSSFALILNEKKIRLISFDRTTGLVVLTVREHILWDDTRKWLAETLDLLGKLSKS
jgi:hypothetical protein